VTPTKGRIVFYMLNALDVQQITRCRTTSESIQARVVAPAPDEQWPLGAQAHIGNPVMPGDVQPMMIVEVAGDQRVNGQVFLDGNDVLWVTDVPEGSGAGMWAWPPRL
jgi:hypothetical protein